MGKAGGKGGDGEGEQGGPPSKAAGPQRHTYAHLGVAPGALLHQASYEQLTGEVLEDAPKECLLRPRATSS